jgi:hypothetical protein
MAGMEVVHRPSPSVQPDPGVETVELSTVMGDPGAGTQVPSASRIVTCALTVALERYGTALIGSTVTLVGSCAADLTPAIPAARL